VNGQARIVGGVPVKSKYEYPFYSISASNRTLCGASLIHGDILLSATHCGTATWQTGIWLGGKNLDHSSSDYYSVQQTILHLLYQRSQPNNDVVMHRKLCNQLTKKRMGETEF
jgi:secreted trypsin-like serine protease